jgi:hypothetical protein
VLCERALQFAARLCNWQQQPFFFFLLSIPKDPWSFKETVLCVEENKKSDLPYRLGINQFADGKLAELYGLRENYHAPY